MCKQTWFEKNSTDDLAKLITPWNHQNGTVVDLLLANISRLCCPDSAINHVPVPWSLINQNCVLQQMEWNKHFQNFNLERNHICKFARCEAHAAADAYTSTQIVRFHSLFKNTRILILLTFQRESAPWPLPLVVNEPWTVKGTVNNPDFLSYVIL